MIVDLEEEFKLFRDKVIKVQRKMRLFIVSGYVSRAQEHFVMVNILPEFQRVGREE